MSQNQNTNWLQRFRQSIGADKLNTWVGDIAQNTANSTATNTQLPFGSPVDLYSSVNDGSSSVQRENLDWQNAAYNQTLLSSSGVGNTTVVEEGGGGGGSGETGGGETGGGPTLGEIKVINGASYSWDGTRWVLVETGGGSGGTGGTGGTGSGGAAGTGSSGTVPQEGDYKAGADGQPLVFKDGRWEVYGARNTREIITEDPNAEPVPGADANVPIDKYMESLGTDTLAGKAYAEALARRMASIDEQQLTAGLSYGDMYEQARMSQAARRGMSDVSGMTGGMADQAQSRMSAAEIASLGQIGMGREATMRQLEMAELNAPMEAFQEGAQMDQFERARQMQDTQVQQAQTLFEQAQSGWVQNEDGTWTNIDKQTQDTLSLQAINATQRAEVLGEIQYWQAVLADSNQASLHEAARENISTLQISYGNLLANNPVISGGPSGTTPPGPGPGPGPEPEPEPEPSWQTDFTAGTLEQNATTFIATKLPTMGLSATDDLPGFRPGIRTDNDLAQSIYNLAGNKAVEGYDFATEIALVNKAAKNSDTLTSAEFDQLKAAGIYGPTQQYHKLFDIGIPTNTGDLRGQTVNFPQNDLMKSFMVYLVNTGMLTENDVARSLRNNVYNISAIDSNQQPRFPQILDEFAKWNATGRPTRKPTTYTGGSAPENPKEGDMWQTPYGKATFKDGRWQ
jgi:hypothetical protein